MKYHLSHCAHIKAAFVFSSDTKYHPARFFSSSESSCLSFRSSGITGIHSIGLHMFDILHWRRCWTAGNLLHHKQHWLKFYVHVPLDSEILLLWTVQNPLCHKGQKTFPIKVKVINSLQSIISASTIYCYSSVKWASDNKCMFEYVCVLIKLYL